MDLTIAFSLLGAEMWAALYWLDKRIRSRKAAKEHAAPELLGMRVFYAAAGIAGQLFYWQMIFLLKNWGGMN